MISPEAYEAATLARSRLPDDMSYTMQARVSVDAALAVIAEQASKVHLAEGQALSTAHNPRVFVAPRPGSYALVWMDDE